MKDIKSLEPSGAYFDSAQMQVFFFIHCRKRIEMCQLAIVRTNGVSVQNSIPLRFVAEMRRSIKFCVPISSHVAISKLKSFRFIP